MRFRQWARFRGAVALAIAAAALLGVATLQAAPPTALAQDTVRLDQDSLVTVTVVSGGYLARCFDSFNVTPGPTPDPDVLWQLTPQLPDPGAQASLGVLPAGTALAFYVRHNAPCVSAEVYATATNAGPGLWYLSQSDSNGALWILRVDATPVSALPPTDVGPVAFSPYGAPTAIPTPTSPPVFYVPQPSYTQPVAYAPPGTCNPSYPSSNPDHPVNLPCASTTPTCNPYFPTPQPAYPVNVPCNGPQAITGPTAVTGTAVGGGGVVVAWLPVSGATSYIVSIASPALATIATPPGTATVVYGLTAGQTYTFTVSAVVGGIAGPAATSNPVVVS
jgi:hypothetical protein